MITKKERTYTLSKPDIAEKSKGFGGIPGPEAGGVPCPDCGCSVDASDLTFLGSSAPT